MIKKETYEDIKQKHGVYASWAVWANEKNEKSPPKENIDDLSIFDLNTNQQLLDYLNPEIIMCGLSWGGDAGVLNAEQVQNYPKFSNFHNNDKIDPVSKKRYTCLDFKLRYAFRNTDFYGAYMTDIIKYYGAVNANPDYINDPKVEVESKKIFLEELNDLDCKNPLIIAIGGKAFNKLTKLFGNVKYNIIPITHYSFAGKFPISGLPSNKENYRDLVLDQLKNQKTWRNYWDKYLFKD